MNDRTCTLLLKRRTAALLFLMTALGGCTASSSSSGDSGAHATARGTSHPPDSGPGPDADDAGGTTNSSRSIDAHLPDSPLGDVSPGAPEVDGSADAFVEPACAPGLVCGALDPVAIAPESGILEVPLKNGNGQHYFCYPASDSGIAPNGLLFIHVVATRSDPALDHEMELEACGHGFASIGPMYENYDEVTGTCDPLGAASDACYTEVHEAVIYGNSYAIPGGTTPASYTPADSLVHRTTTLLSYLASAHPDFPAWQTFNEAMGENDASHVVLAGHSQGSGHSLYWAHKLAPTREIMLSGPPDRIHAANGTTSTPTWITGFSSDAGIGPGQMYGFNNVGDGVVDIGWAMANDDALGMALTQCEFDQTIPTGCHRLVIDAGCGSGGSAGDNAHGTTEVSEFGPSPICKTNASGHNNIPAWRYLLGE